MKSSSFAKTITLGCLVLVAVPVACGDDKSNPSPTPSASAGAGGETVEEGGTGGTGGTSSVAAGAGAGGAAPGLMIPGTSDKPSTITCGTSTCMSIKALSTTPLYVDPCCAGPAEDACGLHTEFFAALGSSFTETCQAQHQEGPVDTTCPDSPDQMLPFNGTTFHVPGFVGCCRAETGTCGVVIDKVTVSELPLPFATPALGCVDSAPFLGEAAGAKTCGAGSGGAAGASSVAGAAGATMGGAGAGGAGIAP